MSISEALGLRTEIQSAIAELAGGSNFPDLVAAVDRLVEIASKTPPPIVATDAMCAAGCLNVSGEWETAEEGMQEMRAAWAAMNAVAPSDDRRTEHKPVATTSDTWPIAKLTVDDSGLIQRAGLYAPGLPPGDHDVWPCPVLFDDEPVAWQWRRRCDPWTLEQTFNSEVFATTDDSEVRPLYAPKGSTP